jgi:hypothetical protein
MWAPWGWGLETRLSNNLCITNIKWYIYFSTSFLLSHVIVLAQPILSARCHLCHKHHILIISIYISLVSSHHLTDLDQTTYCTSLNPIHISRDGHQQAFCYCRNVSMLKKLWVISKSWKRRNILFWCLNNFSPNRWKCLHRSTNVDMGGECLWR